MKLEGRVLWLTGDPDRLRAQLDGADLSPSDAGALRFGVSTDAMISGAACTLGYTSEVLGPWFLDGLGGVVGRDDVLDGGFEVVVGGDAYGSGSSREVAVVAHQGAGIRLVVARSLQRIFQENLVYCGLPFTTDLDVVARLLAGEDVDLGAPGAGLPPLFGRVAEAGGLLRYGTALLAGSEPVPAPAGSTPRPMTCIERIAAATAWTGDGVGVPAVRPGDQVLCRAGFRGLHEYTAGMVMSLYRSEWGDVAPKRPEQVAAFEDHFVLLGEDGVPEAVRTQRQGPAGRLRDEMLDACSAAGIRVHGPGRADPAGVCHRQVVERYARPGEVVVLTDSHSPTAGVLNTLAFGVGSTAMAFALRTGLVPVTVPRTVRVVIEGEPDGVLSPKDVVLHLIGDPWFREERWREGPTDTCAVQYGGAGLDAWSVDELSVLTNMSVEGGLMTGIVEPCETVAGYLRERGERDVAFVAPDDSADYVRTIRVDLSTVPLTVATPGDSRNRARLDELGDVPIHNVVVASCTGGSLADLRAAARVLAGHHVRAGVRLTVTPSSAAVAQAAEADGTAERLRAAGARLTPPGCGACIGNGPGVPAPGETTASTTNRNFDRRMGAPGPVYLVSPAVAAAAAVAGRLIDPRALRGGREDGLR